MSGKEIKYDLSYLNDAINEIAALKSELPFKKGLSYKWNYLCTGESKGNVFNSLSDLVMLTEERSRQIGELLDNVLFVLKTAKKQMESKDETLSKGFKGQ